MNHFATTIALIGIVIVVASLLSGLLERRGIPLVAVFLGLGVLLGPWGLGFVDIGFTSPELQALTTLALAVVLFSDAVTLETTRLRSRGRLLLRLLGPGTLVPAMIVALAAWWLLDVPIAGAAILGAALASTDPVLLRTMLRSPGLPETPRFALRIETGMNDLVLLPIVVISMLFLAAAPGTGVSGGELGRHLLGLFVLGPVLGGLVGWLGIIALSWVRARIGVRRDYESMYALGLAFTGFAAAEAVGGSGFLAAFAAGFMVAAQDIDLCDCFLEYGEATAEMLLLLTFVALGTTLIWTGLDIITTRTLLFAAIALTVRTLVLYPMLGGLDLTRRDRWTIALFGPRGLSSLLLVLLPVFAGISGARELFAITSLVVLISLVLHGGGILLFLRAQHGALAPREALDTRKVGGAGNAATVDTHGEPAADAGEHGATPSGPGATPDRITIGERRGGAQGRERWVMVDARSDRNYGSDGRRAADAVRVRPDDPVRDATRLRLSKRATLVVYCA